MCTSADEEVNKSLPAKIIHLVVRVGLATQVHQTSSLVPSNHSATLQYNMALLYKQEVTQELKETQELLYKERSTEQRIHQSAGCGMKACPSADTLLLLIALIRTQLFKGLLPLPISQDCRFRQHYGNPIESQFIIEVNCRAKFLIKENNTKDRTNNTNAILMLSCHHSTGMP